MADQWSVLLSRLVTPDATTYLREIFTAPHWGCPFREPELEDIVACVLSGQFPCRASIPHWERRREVDPWVNYHEALHTHVGKLLEHQPLQESSDWKQLAMALVLYLHASVIEEYGPLTLPAPIRLAIVLDNADLVTHALGIAVLADVATRSMSVDDEGGARAEGLLATVGLCHRAVHAYAENQCPPGFVLARDAIAARWFGDLRKSSRRLVRLLDHVRCELNRWTDA